MSPRARPPKRRPGTKKQTARTPPVGERGRGEPDLLGDVAEAMAAPHPLALLELVSSLLAALDLRSESPFEDETRQDGPTREELVQSFLGVDLPETSALLAVIGEFSGNELLGRRIHRELAARSHALPDWITHLHGAEAGERAVEVVHVLGDGDNVMVGVRLPGGQELTAVVYIDHNMGTLVKDAFVLPEPIGALTELTLTLADDPDTESRDLDPADARARITEAIELGAMTFPPLESETWPACRPLVEWAAAMLPPGGTGYQRQEWSPDELATLAERFLSSPFGAGFEHHDALVDVLLWFGTDYGPGDPLRWSPVAVEIVLLDWLPRKIAGEVPFLDEAPELLRAFIRFCHHERGIRASLTEQTLDAVDGYAPHYHQLIRGRRPTGTLNGHWLDDEVADDREFAQHTLRAAAGGDDALDHLDQSRLPDEPFEWSAIAPDIHDRVREVLVLVDRCCDELLDLEYRTACRRFLAGAASGDPEIFRRRARADTAAAAVCWVIGKANGLFEPGSGPPTMLTKDLARHFGSGNSASARSGPLLRAIGVDPDQDGARNLGSPGYLTSTRRAQLITLRDRYRDAPR